MPNADNRIVEMTFDNSAFEKNIAQTIKSLDALNVKISESSADKGPAFAGAHRGLQDLTAAAGKFHLGGMASAIEGVSAKFVALSTIAITALANITNKAVDAGLNIAKALTIQAPKSGFEEYELKLGAIQTIMAGSGESLAVVNDKLQELNEYSDQTIYSFRDMTQNIGKFTNAGVSLDLSVASIKGIANAAALSGANAEEASRAMYNFSQALSAGHVKLIDWKSIELANMATKEFKTQLLDSAVAAGTLTQDIDGMYKTLEGTPVSATKGFNESLEEQWLTSEALTATLAKYSDATTDIGARATAAASDVKTFTQMLSTIAESAGSGWAQTFEIIFGDLENAKRLWTRVNDLIGGALADSANARNELLQGWADLGGRLYLIEAFFMVADALEDILREIGEAFREFVPPMTAERLKDMTQSLDEFARYLVPSRDTLDKVREIAEGFFAALEIGWVILKETIDLFKDLAAEVLPSGEGIFNMAEGVGTFLKELNDKLVEGGGIHDFFTRLRDVIKNPMHYIDLLKDKIVDFVDNFDLNQLSIPTVFTDALDRLNERFENLKDLVGKVQDFWGPFKEQMSQLGDLLEGVWDEIAEWFSNLGSRIAGAIKPTDFDPIMDVVNAGLLGGIAVLLGKFLSGGLKMDFGQMGFFDAATDTLKELTGVLTAMQTEIKSDALMKIAAAVALLAGSVLVMSLIDPEDLSKSLGAMAGGFAQLLGMFAVMTKMSMGPSSAASFAIIATGMTLVAGAMLLLSISVSILSRLSWEELAKGLVGVLALLTIMSMVVPVLADNSTGMIKAGAGLILIGVALNILAAAMKIFATMSWGEMGKGLVAVAGGLLAISVGMDAMPKDMAMKGVGLILVATALNILALAMKSFAQMDWGEMGKGFVGIGVGLVIIAGAMQLMPATLPVTAAGLVLVGVALLLIAKALAAFGGMSWGEIGKGLITMGGALLVLSMGAAAMEEALPGAVAIAIMAASMMVMVKVMKELAAMSAGDIVTALLALAGVLVTLGLTAAVLQPLIPAMLGLGAAILLLGAGLALIGVGAQAMALAFGIFAKAGKAGVAVFIELMDAVISRIPDMITAFAKGMVNLGLVFLEAVPMLVEALTTLVTSLLDALTKLMPSIFDTIREFISQLIKTVIELTPQVVELGFQLIMGLLNGIRDHIPEIVTVGSEIVRAFLDTLTKEIPKLNESIANVIITLFTSVAETVGKVAGSLALGISISFLTGFVDGLTGQLSKVWDWISGFVTGVIDKIKSFFGIASPSSVMDAIGVDLIVGFLNGIVKAAVDVATWFTGLVSDILGWIGNSLTALVSTGVDFIAGLLNGIEDKIGEVMSFYKGLVGDILGWIGNTFDSLWSKGWGLIVGLFRGITEKWAEVWDWIAAIPGKVIDAIGDVTELLLQTGEDIFDGLWDGLKNIWNKIWQWIKDQVAKIPGPFKWILDMASPSRVMRALGEDTMLGFHMGLEDEWDKIVNWLNGLGTLITDQFGTMDEFTPIITPVLDLTGIQRDAKQIAALLPPNPTLTPDYSYAQANLIASTSTETSTDAINGQTGTGEVKFEQNIYAPTQLSTADIYRQTRNQITLAKEELSIP